MIGSFAHAFAFACGKRTTSRKQAPGKAPRRRPHRRRRSETKDILNGGTMRTSVDSEEEEGEEENIDP